MRTLFTFRHWADGPAALARFALVLGLSLIALCVGALYLITH